jgi:hypothetical protein
MSADSPIVVDELSGNRRCAPIADGKAQMSSIGEGELICHMSSIGEGELICHMLKVNCVVLIAV